MPSGEQKGEGEGVSLTYSTRPRSRRRGHKMVPETAAGMVVEAVDQMKVRGHRSLPSKGSIQVAPLPRALTELKSLTVL